MSLRLSLALVAFVFCLSAVEARPVDAFKETPWEGHAVIDDASNTFSVCTASARYRSGAEFFVRMDRSYGWAIGLSSPSGKFTLKGQSTIKFRIDKGPWQTALAEPVSRDFTVVSMSGGPLAVEVFQSGQTMAFDFGGGRRALFDLTGTRRLMDTLRECVDYRLALERSLPAPKQPNPNPPTAEGDKPPTVDASTGTGFVVTSKGHIVTNEHVVNGCDEAIVRRSGDRDRSARVIVSDKRADLALLETDMGPGEGSIAALATTRSVVLGEKIVVYGFPLPDRLSTEGIFADGAIAALSGIGNDISHFQISAQVQPGNSGGPLLDLTGSVIGVVDSRLGDPDGKNPQNVNFAIKSSVLEDFLRSHSVGYIVSERKTLLELPEVAALAKRFTVMIVCFP